MSKTWKIVIGVVGALVLVGVVALHVVGALYLRGRAGELGWEHVAARWEEAEGGRELEVELEDVDGDGVPDRGVVELPEAPVWMRGRFHRPGVGVLARGRGFAPFLFVGGLIRLARLGGLIALGIVLYRQWRKAHLATPPAGE